ncbi:MAG: PaaX family transcriptional regulator [Deltaproteobacteria bacterium]|nr:PaaX family transcriptional regulator [Deltaproteobacteria bacterium]
MSPTPKSVVLDLLSTMRGGALPVRALVAAAALFGISENSLRVALARLRASGMVGSDHPGLYRLGARAEAVNRLATSWRSIDRTLRTWSGRWIAVVGGEGARGTQRSGRALAFLGFRNLRPDLALRPDNLAGGIAATTQRLAELGLDPSADVFGLHDLAPATARRATRLWDTGAIRQGYHRTVAELERSERALAALPREQAMAESFLVGGRAIRQLVLDPRLPDTLVPAAERRALVDTLLRYDRAGRDRWASFLREMGAEPGDTPAHSRFTGDEIPGTDELPGAP